MDARTYLEELQREVWSKLERSGFRSHKSRLAQAHLQSWLDSNPELDPEQVRRDLDEIASNRASRLDEPFTLAVLENLQAKIEAAAKSCGMRLPPLPLVGSLPTGDVNAFAAKVPGASDTIVVLHCGVIGFIYLLSKLVASCIPERPAGEGGDDIHFSLKESELLQTAESNETIRLRFIDLMEGYLLHGNPFAARPYILREPHATLAMVLCESAELLVLCHEFGHVLAGHFAGAELQHHSIHGVDLNVVPASWDKEYEADLIALDLTLRAMRHEGLRPSVSYLGAELFFAAVEVLLRCRGILQRGDEAAFLGGTTSHPPIADRRASLRKALGVIVGSELARVPLAAGEVLSRTVRHLLALTKAHFIALHESHARSSPIWNA